MSMVSVESASAVLTSRVWPFASEYAADIDAYWRERRATQPGLFNGEVLLLCDWSLSNGVFACECLKADFKSFLFWRSFGSPDVGVFDFFSCAAVHSRESRVMVGIAGARTAYPGAVFPPCGSLHPDDVAAPLSIWMRACCESFAKRRGCAVPHPIWAPAY